MSRNDLTRADVDTGLMSDPKVGRLARRLRDPERTSAAVGLYMAVLLASWRDGERLTVEEALPGWWLGDHAELAQALVDVRLLDHEERIPEHAWGSWYGEAVASIERTREAAREAGRKGGIASGRSRRERSGSGGEGSLDDASSDPSSDATNRRTPSQPSLASQPSQPSQPAYPAVLRATLPPGFDGEVDVLDCWYRLTASPPTKPAIRKWLDELERSYGAAEVVAALAEAYRVDPDRATLLTRAQNLLWERERDAAAERERQRILDREAERQRVESMTDEQRAANLARLGQMLADKGLVPPGKRGGSDA